MSDDDLIRRCDVLSLPRHYPDMVRSGREVSDMEVDPDGQCDWISAHAIRSIPAATPRPMAEARDVAYVVWSHEHGAWWRPQSAGYTRDVRSAGVYSRAEALRISHKGRDGWRAGEVADELPVAVSDLPQWAQDALLAAIPHPEEPK